VFDGSCTEALEACRARIRHGLGGRVATVNLDFLAIARKNHTLRQHLHASDLVIADGMPVVWLAKVGRAARIERYAGVDLVRDLFQLGLGDRKLRIAIYGSTEDVAGQALPQLEALGAAAVVEAIHPPFRVLSAEEKAADLARLRAAAPDVVLVALGCPAQEALIAEWHPELAQALWIGVGGTFDFFAGRRKRAPQWAQRAGMEWVVRMSQEPKRLGRRYLLRDIPALIALAPGTWRARRLASPRLDS